MKILLFASGGGRRGNALSFLVMVQTCLALVAEPPCPNKSIQTILLTSAMEVELVTAHSDTSPEAIPLPGTTAGG